MSSTTSSDADDDTMSAGSSSFDDERTECPSRCAAATTPTVSHSHSNSLLPAVRPTDARNDSQEEHRHRRRQHELNHTATCGGGDSVIVPSRHSLPAAHCQTPLGNSGVADSSRSAARAVGRVAACANAIDAANKTRVSTAKKRWNIACLFAVRCLCSAAGSFVMVSSSEMLLRVFQGNTARSQRVMSALSTASIVATFLTGPLSGALIDSWGRRACVWVSLLCAGLLRVWVSLRPSVARYVVYRIALSVLLQPLFPALRAALSDIVPRSSDKYLQLSMQMETASTVVRIVGLYVVGKLGDPRTGMLAAAACSLSAALVAFAGLRETLTPAKARPVNWTALGNPLGSVADVLEKCPPMKPLVALYVLLSIPANNGCLGMYRRARFRDWDMADESWLSIQGELWGCVVQISAFN